ncbi:hypothetical protein HKD37_02G005146 [Glycine soja]
MTCYSETSASLLGEVIQFKIESAIGKGDEPILLELRLEQLAAIINKYSSNQCPRLLKIIPLVATLKKSSHDGLLEFQALLHSQLTKLLPLANRGQRNK